MKRHKFFLDWLILGLWLDVRGGIAPIDTILVTSLTAIGAMIGLAVIRDAVVQEMGDVAVALDNVDQSFSGTIVHATLGTLWSASFTDDIATLSDPEGSEPACLDVQASPTDEGSPLAAVGTPFP
jgi:hypothetical protein